MSLDQTNHFGFDASYAAAQARRYLPLIRRYFRSRIEGLERVPDGRTFIGVGNHGGGIMMPDVALLLFTLCSEPRETPVLFLTHQQMLKAAPRLFGRFFRGVGAIGASADNARRALSSGCAVQIYPGGDRDVFRSFARRNEIRFADRKGYVRLALESGRPILPVVSAGAHESIVVLSEGRAIARLLGLSRKRIHVFPVILGAPFGLWLGYLPGYLPLPAQITLRILPEITLDGASPSDADRPSVVDEIDREVRARMQAALDDLGHRRSFFVG